MLSILPVAFAILSCTSGATSVKGVSPDLQGRYQPDAEGYFTCLGTPDIKIPYDRVNDDYCDCPDGSDEPGTAACANGQFYCHNVGHVPAWLPSRNVGDGACDYEICCDGSDEAPGVCPDRCKEIAARHKAESEKRAAILENGLAERAKLVEKSKVVKSEQEARIKELDTQLVAKQTELDQARIDLEQAVADAPQLSAEQAAQLEAVRSPLSDSLQAFENHRAELQRVEGLRVSLDGILAKMKEEYNPNFNDPAVKQAIRSWEELAAGNSAGDLLDQSLINRVNTALTTLDDLELQLVGNVGPSQKPLLDSAVSWVKNLFIEQLEPVESGRLVSGSQKQAQDRVNALERSVNELATSRARKAESLNRDYGDNDVFRALEGTCVASHLSDYEYEVCFFGKTSQKGNGQSTTLGHYDSYSQEPNSIKLMYEKGAQCWNGPVRRAVVTLRCGEKQEIVSVAEAEKCTYDIVMLSPAACSPVSERQDSGHDEL